MHFGHNLFMFYIFSLFNVGAQKLLFSYLLFCMPGNSGLNPEGRIYILPRDPHFGENCTRDHGSDSKQATAKIEAYNNYN